MLSVGYDFNVESNSIHRAENQIPLILNINIQSVKKNAKAGNDSLQNTFPALEIVTLLKRKRCYSVGSSAPAGTIYILVLIPGSALPRLIVKRLAS